MLKRLLIGFVLVAVSDPVVAQVSETALITAESPDGRFIVRAAGQWYEGWTSPVQITETLANDTLWSREVDIWGLPVVNNEGEIAVVGEKGLVTLNSFGDTLQIFAPSRSEAFYTECADCWPMLSLSHDGHIVYTLLQRLNTYSMSIVAIDVEQGELWRSPLAFDRRDTPVGVQLLPFEEGVIVHNYGVKPYGQCYLLDNGGSMIAQFIVSGGWNLPPTVRDEHDALWIRHRKDIRAYSTTTGRSEGRVPTKDIVAMVLQAQSVDAREWGLQALYYRIDQHHEQLDASQYEEVRATIDRIEDANKRAVFQRRLLNANK